MQHDDARRITMLLDNPDRDAFSLRTYPQLGQQFEPVAGSP